MSDFVAFCENYRPKIESELNLLLTSQVSIGDEYIRLLQDLRVLVSHRGKHLRPLLFLLMHEVYGGKNDAEAIQVAALIELLHTFLLIHDDIIDDSIERWGGPNIAGQSLKRGDSLQLAQSRALLAGDACLNLVYRYLPAQLVPLFSETIAVTIDGQLHDMAQDAATRPPSETAVLDMYRAKTARYTFGLPLAAAAVLTDVTPPNELANDLGIAFQLQDDLHDITEDTQQRKRTLLWVLTWQRSAAEQRAVLESDDYKTAQKLMAETGAKAEVENLVGKYKQQALAQASKLNASLLLEAIETWLPS